MTNTTAVLQRGGHSSEKLLVTGNIYRIVQEKISQWKKVTGIRKLHKVR